MQAKNEGNDAFKAADYPKAIDRYTEALKRGPPGQWEEAYKCFSNRAACYTKLGAMPEGARPLPPHCTLISFPDLILYCSLDRLHSLCNAVLSSLCPF